MKKILFFINNLGSGGAQRQLVELAKGYKELGYNVKILIYQELWSEYYISHISEFGVTVDGIYERKYIKRIWLLRKYLLKNKFDVIISFLETPCFYVEIAGLFIKRWKLIVGERSADPSKCTRLILRIFIYFHLLSDYIVANSQANIDIIKSITRVIPEKKFRVIYNMYDVNKIRRENFEYNIWHENNRFKLLIASSHRYLKNLNGLVEAVNLLEENLKQKLQILWYGSNLFDDSLYDAKVKITKYHLDSIFEFYEPTLDIYKYMSNADAIGLFSFFEGLPNAICEAMLLEKPVIVTTVSDIPILLKDNVNGFLCNPDDPISIAGALRKVLHCTPEELSLMGANNRQLAQEIFSKEKVLSQYAELFD